MSEVPPDPAQEIARLRTLLSEREAALIARQAELEKAQQREAKLAEKVKSLGEGTRCYQPL